MSEPKHRTRSEPARDKARPLPPERRHSPVRQRPDRRLPSRKPEWNDPCPDDDDGHGWAAATLVDPDFDDFGEDLDRLVGYATDPFDDDDETWIGLRP